MLISATIHASSRFSNYCSTYRILPTDEGTFSGLPKQLAAYPP